MGMARQIVKKVTGLQTSDGAGVKLTRIIGSRALPMLDPFLMLDAFKSDNADDYIAGFPPHPHRGFETITYLLHGNMRHKDNAGHEGIIRAGGVQWMTAGSGVIHSEMPEQEDGLLHGFQFWLNLPAKDKMTEPRYQEVSDDEIPVDVSIPGVKIKVISGKTESGLEGVIKPKFVVPTLFDITMKAESSITLNLNLTDNAFIYCITGQTNVGEQSDSITENELAVLTEGKHLRLVARSDSQILFASAPALNEPIARSGPFVMTTQQQIQQAYADFSR
jgi:hypothetical protein